MKNKRIFIILSFLLVALLCVSSAAASEDNIDDNLTSESSGMELEINDESDFNALTASDDSALSEPQTIVVDNIGDNLNEMNKHTIRNVIRSANDGDTIIIQGSYYEHVHLSIDKKLNIVSNVGTTMDPCTSTAFSNHIGMLYLTSGASGSVIEGFNFVNADDRIWSSGDYAIFIDGASDVIIRNCTFNNGGYGDAIRVENAQNTLITDVFIENANCGINIVNSNQTRVENSNINNNKVAGVAVAGSSVNSTIIYNNIANNKVGFNLTSSNNVYILSNYIAKNYHGVYVNCNVNRIEIKGNFFNQNTMYEVLNDYRVRNFLSADKRTGYDDLEIIDNNYMIGLAGSDAERPVYRITYDYKGANRGAYTYDSVNDVYKYVGDNKGEYVANKGAVFLRYVFEINKNVQCPVIYFEYGPDSWSLSGNYELQLSEITQVKKGVYSISIVDENGNVASDLSSVPITFYLNKEGKSATPQSGDVYKTVVMKNGTATVRFSADDFKESGNVITAVAPTPGANIDNKVSKTFSINDSSIPGNMSNTSIAVSDLSTYPNSNQEFVATLLDENNVPISGETLTFKIDGKSSDAITDSNGQAKINVFLEKEGNYTMDVTYISDQVEYYGSSVQVNVVVKKQTAKTSIGVSDLSTYPNSNQEFVATLLDENNNPIANQTLTFKVGDKTSNSTTDSNGQAKIKISIAKEGTYTLEVNYLADGIEYNSSSARASVVVKKQSTKIISSNVVMVPKMAEYYSITLKDESNNPIPNQKVTFSVNGKNYKPTTDSKGVAKVSLKFTQNKKTYNIAIKFAGNDKYKASSKTNKITVKYSSKTAKLTAPSVTIAPKTSKTYTVTLKDANSKGISKQKVTIKVNGKTYTKTTNSKGQASVKVKFSSLKTYKVSASYKGSNIYKKASATGKIKVAKTTTKITAPTVSVLPKESKTYTVTLKANDKALAKQKVTIKINGKTYTKTTDSKGQASVSVNFASEKTYLVNVNYKGTVVYKASSATGKIIVSKAKTQLDMYDKTFSKDSPIDYQIALKDNSGNALKNQKISYSINNDSFTQITDVNGQIKLDFTNQTGDSFDITASFSGNNQYSSVSKAAKITIVNKTGVVFVDSDLPNAEIQNILDNAAEGSNVEVLGDYYFDIALTINKPVNIYSNDKTILNAKEGSPTLTIASGDVNLTNFVVKGNSGDAIVIGNANNVVLVNNSITNGLDESKIESYADGTEMIPGYGISISNSTNIKAYQNHIEAFESGIFAEHSSEIVIDDNVIVENNYGIKYGFGVANTQIINNKIMHSVGLIIMTIPEGPTGYGVYLNNSAVNVTINKNYIYDNFIGISLDANYSTGIVITQNTITDQILEGIRFNAGYDLAENAVEPHVTDNAIYRNARGPSMMILGEMSANPFGIYGNGLYNASDKLQLEANWYGTNQIVTWDYDTGVVGYGTMCPRINTSEIKFNEIAYKNGGYEVVFYKNGIKASNLPEFDLFATLNWGNNKAVEVNFKVVDGVGTFAFNPSDYLSVNNTISITVATLINSSFRVPKVIYSYDVSDSEIVK